MIDPRTLRGQLALAYAAALLVALIAFAALTLFVVDRTQRAALDSRLSTALRAVTAIANAQSGRIELDPDDRRQFAHIVGNRLAAAITTLSGSTIASTAMALPDGAVKLAVSAADVSQIATMPAGEETLRVAMTRLPRQGHAAGVALVWADLDDIGEIDRRLALVFALSIVAFAVFAVLAGSAVAARGLQPLNTIASVASEIEGHDLSRRLDLPPRNDELGRLAATFDRMLDRLEAAFARQRRFTSDASHELRAPLSVIRAEADLTLRRPRSPEDYERALRSIASQADDLEALTRDLLAAARSENLPPASPVDAAGVAREAITGVEKLVQAHGASLAVRTDGADAYLVRANSESLQRALVCVIHNALRYGKERGTIDVRVDRDGATVRLSVADDGPGFSEGALLHATERFWRDDPARSHAAPEAGGPTGAGLGLAIARATIETAGGTLMLENVPRGGARVVMTLPAVSAQNAAATNETARRVD